MLGFDVCLDHHADDFAEQLAKACPQGIDIYYENVGGKVFDAVLPLLNTSARIPLCGLVSGYNATQLPAGPDRLPLLMGTLLKKDPITGFYYRPGLRASHSRIPTGNGTLGERGENSLS